MTVLPPTLDIANETERIASFISRFADDRGAAGIVLGLSGGIDSAVVAALCVRALGRERVTALMLPERDSSPRSAEDAREYAELLGIGCEIRDLTPALRELGCYERASSGVARLGVGTRLGIRLMPAMARKGFLMNLDGGGGKHFQEFIAFHRIKHRLRMVALYRTAEERHLCVASCANRTERETGFFVRYGDDAGDIAPIAHLYKTQVFAVGRHLSIPERILEKHPSPDLFGGVKDEEIMGITYETLDAILSGIDAGLGRDEIARAAGVDPKSIDYVREIRARSERLRRPPAMLPADETRGGDGSAHAID